MTGNKTMIKKISPSRNGEIDFWKFIFSIIIVLHHSYNFMPEKSRYIFTHGSICVDFFLIISGFFMASSVFRISSDYHSDSIGTETIQFIFKKIKSFLYYYIFSSAIIFITAIIKDGISEVLLTGKMFNLVFSAIFLNMSGLPFYDPINSSWYLSAMLLCMMIIYPVFRKNKNLFINVIAPLTAIFLYGYIMKTTNFVGDPTHWYGYAFKGLIRGFAGLSLGCTAYNISEWLKNKNISKPVSVLLSVYETFAIFGIILLLYITAPTDTSAALVFIFFTAFIIIASRKAFINRIYQYNFFQFTGKLSMAMFLIHYAGTNIMSVLCENVLSFIILPYSSSGRLKLTLIYISIVFILGFACVLICDKIKNYLEKRKEKQIIKTSDKINSTSNAI